MHASLLICYALNVSRVMAFTRCIGEHFKFRLLDFVPYIGVLFHTFYYNVGRAEEYRSLYRGFSLKGVYYIRFSL